MQIHGVKGMPDILPPDGQIWRIIENRAADVFGRFGYEEVRTPVLEHTELFARSIGTETDIVSKEMYTFEDKGGRSVTLRPEGTAPLVRAYVEHKLHGRQPVNRFFYVGPMFRYERAQKGRLRQFHQLGAEIYGLPGPLADAEIVAMQHLLFTELAVPGLSLEINNLGSTESRALYAEALRSHLKTNAAVLCGDCIRRTDTNPLRALDCKVPSCAPVVAAAPSILDYSDPLSQEHFDAFRRRLDSLSIPYVINGRIVRGLDYYTKVVFEFTSSMGLGAKNTLSAGGRYDELISQLGGAATPAVGFACGIERLLMLLGEAPAKLSESKHGLYVAALSTAAGDAAAPLIMSLRARGIRVEEDFNRPGLKSQMKSANRAGAAWVLLLGDDELARGTATLRNMTTGEQGEVPMDAAAVAGKMVSA